MNGKLRDLSPRIGQPKDASVQGGRAHRTGERIQIDERILQMAEAEYERQYSQPIWKVRERGGLDYGEVVTLLAEALYRYVPEDKLVPKTLTKD